MGGLTPNPPRYATGRRLSTYVVDKRSFDFVHTRLLMKLFKTSCTGIIHECRVTFDVKSVSDLILNRKHNFYEVCEL